MAETVKPETWVYYHGSITEKHGVMKVVHSYPPLGRQLNDEDTVRYTMEYGPRWSQCLENVRPGSFDVIGDFWEVIIRLESENV